MRTATPADVPAVRTLLAQGFVDDPLMVWEMHTAEPRVEAVAAWISFHVELYLTAPGAAGLRGRVTEDDNGRVTGAALWRWPDGDLSAPDRLPTPGGLLTALVGTEHAADVAAGFAAERAVRPQTPHAYLHYLAVAPDRRRRGEGRLLVEEGLARAAADGLPTLLETAEPANLPFYERLGFAVTTEVRLGTGPVLWLLTHD